MMKSILVLRGGALGDFLVTLPALQALRARWPAARIDLVGNGRAALLGAEAGLLDSVAAQDRGGWHTLYTASPDPVLLRRLSAYDVIINFWPDPEGDLAGLFPLCRDQQFIAAPAHPSCGPAARHYLAALAPLDVGDTPLLRPLRNHRPQAGRIAIHAGSGSPAKNWPAENWRHLITWLHEIGFTDTHLIRGEAEPPDLLTGLTDTWDSLPLTQLADELACCALFLGHDSGVSHLAAACGCPGLLLFGPTDPAVWAPPASTMRVLQTPPPMDNLTLGLVQQELRAVLSGQR